MMVCLVAPKLSRGLCIFRVAYREVNTWPLITILNSDYGIVMDPTASVAEYDVTMNLL